METWLELHMLNTMLLVIPWFQVETKVKAIGLLRLSN